MAERTKAKGHEVRGIDTCNYILARRWDYTYRRSQYRRSSECASVLEIAVIFTWHARKRGMYSIEHNLIWICQSKLSLKKGEAYRRIVEGQGEHLSWIINII